MMVSFAKRGSAVMRILGLVNLLLFCSCDKDPETCYGLEPPADLSKTFGGERPTTISVSPRYDHSCPTPLLVLLHGYGASGVIQSLFFDTDTFLDDHALIIAAPDGTTDIYGKAYWNSGDACCDFFDKDVDDVAYLKSLIVEISAVYTIDSNRIYVLGHSNGAFMAYQLACAWGDELAAIASLAGASPLSLENCADPAPSVLHIHGTEDDIVLYEGGSNLLDAGGPAYPGAQQSAELWAAKLGCAADPIVDDTVDFDLTIPGAETVRQRYSHCSDDKSVELWSVEGGEHIPMVFSPGLELIWAWMQQ
jgi:polyhydroxybutyrate depolymerase